VRRLREVKVKGMDARVLDVEIADGKSKAVLTAWNILADFLNWLLSNKQVNLFLINKNWFEHFRVALCIYRASVHQQTNMAALFH
jgi:hypothetical protein